MALRTSLCCRVLSTVAEVPDPGFKRLKNLHENTVGVNLSRYGDGECSKAALGCEGDGLSRGLPEGRWDVEWDWHVYELGNTYSLNADFPSPLSSSSSSSCSSLTRRREASTRNDAELRASFASLSPAEIREASMHCNREAKMGKKASPSCAVSEPRRGSTGLLRFRIISIVFDLKPSI